MSNPKPGQFVDLLVAALAAIIGDATPKTATDTSAANTADPAQADDTCNCAACNLRRLLEGKERKAGVKFDLHLGGRLSPEVVERVGGLKDVDEEMQSMRLAAAVLMACAHKANAEDSATANLQAQAIEHFEKGIKALNELLASTTSESGATA